MAPLIYLINPIADYPTYYSSETYARWGLGSFAFIADLAITTVAGMVPGDFRVSLCDENIAAVDFDSDADFIGITGKITQWTRMKTIAQEFRKRKKTVIIGGPFASLSPEMVRPYCEIIVRGEMEDIAESLFADLRAGVWKDEYLGGKPDLAKSPMPRWDLYPNDRALSGALQTSRGCPFDCEFCDVIAYLGRKQRHKPIANVLAELDELYRFGYRAAFIADDNFTVYRRRTKELLAAMAHWNTRQAAGRVSFSTQVSIDVARDSELLQMCIQAGLNDMFIGIETPNKESLRESGKRQNVKCDLVDQVECILEHGISVTGGMICGFDSDGPDIFERQYQFAMSTPIPIFTLGALVAPAATPLHARMKKSGRLLTDGSEIAAAPWNTNIIPKQFSREQLLAGIQWLANKLYHPNAFEARVFKLMDNLGKAHDRLHDAARKPSKNLRSVEQASRELLSCLSRLGQREADMLNKISRRISRQPWTAEYVINSLALYAQIRFLYEHYQIWDPSLASSPSPHLDAVIPASGTYNRG